MDERAKRTTFTSGLPRAVNVAAIERELTQVWKSAAETRDESSPAVTRSALLNLIVHARGADAEVAASETVAAVSAELPCRALVLVEDESPGRPPLEAWISAHCTPAGRGRRQVCCEQVTLRAAPPASERLPSTVLALLGPDLPVVLWWPGDPDLEGPFFARLSRHVDPLCGDSDGYADARLRLASLRDWRTADGGHEVCDLGWERLSAWREMVAGFFDAPPFRDLLPALDGLEIESASPGPGKGGAAQAALLGGWLASRLGWKIGARGAGASVLESPAGSVRLALRTRAGTKPGGLQRVVLHADAARTRFVVELDALRPSTLVARVECPAACPLPLCLEIRSADADTQLLRVLLRTGRNPAFEQALDAAAALLEAGA